MIEQNKQPVDILFVLNPGSHGELQAPQIFTNQTVRNYNFSQLHFKDDPLLVAMLHKKTNTNCTLLSLNLRIDEINTLFIYYSPKNNSEAALFIYKILNYLKSYPELKNNIVWFAKKYHVKQNVLFEANSSGNKELLDALIETVEDANMSFRSNGNNTMLHLSTDPEIFKFLLEKGANPNAKNNGGYTPLDFAKKPEIVKILLDAKADPLKKDEFGNSILFTNVGNKDDPDTVKLLLNAKVDLHAINNIGESILHYAVNPSIVKILLEAKANLEVKNYEGKTPLYYAVEQPEIVELLLNAKANPNAQCNTLGTPLHKTRNPKVVELLINAKADPNAKDWGNVTPLENALRQEFPKLANIKLLLDAKSNPNGDRVTPLLYALSRGLTDSVNHLLQANADPNIKDKNGRTALEFAIDCMGERNFNIESIESLLNAKANPNVLNQGVTPLSLTIASQIMKLLLEAKADPNRKNYHGETLLHRTRDPMIVKLLLDAKANPNLQNSMGTTSLHGATESHVVKLLLAAGADIYVKDFFRQTPFDNAKYLNPEIKKLFYQARNRLRLDEAKTAAVIGSAIGTVTYAGLSIFSSAVDDDAERSTSSTIRAMNHF